MQGRYWTFIVYPESVKENWENELEEIGLQFCISPLHDKDIDMYAEGGPEKKKPHYHVIVEYEGPKRYKNIKEEICDRIGATIPKKVESLRGMYAYLTHKNNPEKAQYNEEDIKSYNGFNVELTNTEVTLIKIKICDEIVKHDIHEYSDLIDYFRNIGDYDYLDIASNNTYFFDKYITSRRHKEKIMTSKVKANK